MAIVERFIASFLFAGAITAYQTAFTLRNVPITLIGAAIATAAFPKFSSLAARNENKFRHNFIAVMRTLIWLSLPATVIALIMRGYLVRLLLGSGSPVIAMLLGWLALSIVFRTLFQISTRAFYAHQDTSTPLRISIVALLLNIVLAFLLVDDFGIAGLAIAQSTVALFEIAVLFLVLQRRIGRLLTKPVLADVGKMLIASAVTAVANYALVSRVFPLLAVDTGFFTLAPKFALMVGISAAAYVTTSALLGLKETKPIVETLRGIVFKPVKIEPQ